jgi:hypothetical protein
VEDEVRDEPGSLSDRLGRLAAHAEFLRQPGFSAGRWHEPRHLEDGSMTMPWFELSPEAADLVRAASTLGFVRPFDWMTWIATPEAAALMTAEGTRGATAEDISKLMTTLVRRDRFVEGTLDAAFESGLLLAILERARELSGAG